MDAFEELQRAIAQSEALRAADHDAGRARIGGIFASPDYLTSYLRASQALVRTARETGSFNTLAVACLYLQRHALELALKALIGMLHAVADNDVILADLTGQPVARPMPSQGERDRLNRSHDLEQLFADVVLARQREVDLNRDFRQITAGLHRLVRGFTALEANDETRFRYPQVRVGKGKAVQLVDSFPKSISIPVMDLQHQLEAVVRELFGSFDDVVDSLGRDIDDVVQGQNQRIYPLLPPGEVVHVTSEDE